MAISMLKIRRPLGRLIFNMGIAIPGKTVFLIETAPWLLYTYIKRIQIEVRRSRTVEAIYLLFGCQDWIMLLNFFDLE